MTDDADEGVGVTQTEIVTEEDGNPKRTTHVVGKYTESSIMAGSKSVIPEIGCLIECDYLV